GNIPRLCSLVCAKAANVIDQAPDLLRTDARLTLESCHRGAEAVPDVDEYFAVCRSMVPFAVRQIRRFWFPSLGKLFSLLAIAVAGRAVTICTQAIIKSLA